MKRQKCKNSLDFIQFDNENDKNHLIKTHEVHTLLHLQKQNKKENFLLHRDLNSGLLAFTVLPTELPWEEGKLQKKFIMSLISKFS